MNSIFIENKVRQNRENKYAFQVSLKDLDFVVNEELLQVFFIRFSCGTRIRTYDLRVMSIRHKTYMADWKAFTLS